jgi:multimeric flavodoxin WrbA
MKVTVLNGVEEKDIIYQTLTEELKRRSYSLRSFPLLEMEVAGCLGCFGCWIKTPGICVIDDAGREIAKAVIGSDLTVILSPVTFGGYSYHIKKAVDRLIPLISPLFTEINEEIHHKPRYKKYPALLAIGVLLNEDNESAETFKKVIGRNAINFHSPAWATYIHAANLSFGELDNKIKDLVSRLEACHEQT